MKIYANTSYNELDEFICSGMWVECDVTEWGRPWAFPTDEKPRYSRTSFAQFNPSWVNLYGKISKGGIISGDESVLDEEDFESMQILTDNFAETYYFANIVERCTWDIDHPDAPISKFDRNQKGRILDTVLFVKESDITLIQPIEMLSTEELFDTVYHGA